MQQGDDGAFTELYRHYSPQLYLNILAMVRDPLLAEEMVQELFTRIWQKRSYAGMGENFSGYIVRVGQHLVHDFFRKLKSERDQLELFRLSAELNYEGLEDAVERKESMDMLEKAVRQLPPQQKKAYELVRIHGHSYKEAAEIMGISVFTVKEYLVAAKKSIQKHMLSCTDLVSSLLFFALLRSLS